MLVGGCVALDEGGLPWAPVVDALRGLVRSVEPQVLEALVGIAGEELGQLLVLTYRTDELGRGHPLRPLLGELGRSERVDRVDLYRLGRSEMSALIDAILEASAPAGLVEDIFVRSDGNPFYAEELLAAWRQSEHVGERPGLPGSLRDTLLARVERLSGPCGPRPENSAA